MSKYPKDLKEKINAFPTKPGIYKMLDSENRIIYIGKSISLKNRVKSYFVKNHKWEKVEKMVSLIDDIEYIVTDTHLEAVLLECELIKKIKPIFNAQLKNHEKYVYLKIEDYNIHNSLSIVSNREENSHGPFRSKSTLMEFIGQLKNLYPIVKDSSGYRFSYELLPISMDRDGFEKNKESLEEILLEEDKMALFMGQLDKEMVVYL